MARTQAKTIVQGVSNMIGTYEKREGRFLVFFKTNWWEKISEKHIGNDIFIETTNPIQNVYLNGTLLTLADK